MAGYRAKVFLVLFLTAVLLLGEGLAFPLRVKDVRGKELKLNQKPQRIVSLVPSVTEILYSLGLAKEVVGVTSQCSYPPEAKQKAVVGGLFLDYEKLMALNPDLIIAEASLRAPEIRRLDQLGAPLLVVNSRDIGELKQSVKLIGRATGREQAAAKLLGDFEQELKSLQKNLPPTPPRVFVEIWYYPLMSVGRGTFIDQLITLAGGKNIVRELKGGYGDVSLEEVICRDPQIILLTSARPEDLYRSPVWQATSAVRGKRVYPINPDLLVRPTLRLTQTLKQLNRLFNPSKEQK